MSFTPNYDRKNVLVGLARMFVQPSSDIIAVLPENTVVLGGAWDSPWKELGATVEGLSFEVSRDTNDITIEEQMTPVDVRTSSMSFTANVELSEDTLEVMKLAYGGGTIDTVAADVSTPGISTLTISNEMNDFAFAFEGQNESGLWRRVLIPVVKSVGDIKTAYRRADSQRTYQVSFQSLVAPDKVKIVNCDALATT